jgi:tRNA C32,U32 (ribose-2'-O)-methylase TrmJ
MVFQKIPDILSGRHQESRKSEMKKVERDALESCVKGIIEHAISALQAIGMTNDAALKLLMIQASIRMEDTAELRRVLKSIKDGLAGNDDDDCGVDRRR